MKYFEKYDNEICDAEMPINVATAEKAISDHENLQSNIASLSVDGVDEELRQVSKLLI